MILINEGNESICFNIAMSFSYSVRHMNGIHIHTRKISPFSPPPIAQEKNMLFKHEGAAFEELQTILSRQFP